MGELVKLERPTDGVVRVVMSRNELKNALDAALARALRESLEEAAGDDTVRAVVLAGGEKMFSVGGDIRMMQEAGSAGRPDVLVRVIDSFHAAVLAIATMPKPVIAAVCGGAGGGGLSLMMACDLAVVDEAGKFVVGFNAIGLSPDGGSTFHLARLAGLKRATELCFLNQVFDGRRAVELGLANRAVPIDKVEEEALALATKLAAGPTRAFARTKELLRAGRSLGESLDAEAESIAALSSEVDAGEGIDAFLEKREPRFRAR